MVHRQSLVKILVLITLFVGFATSVKADSVSYSINSAWQFRRADTAQNAWETVDIPHTWNIQDVDDDTPGYYRGKGFYRKSLLIPPYAEGKRIYLKFEGIGQECDVFVDGLNVASHLGSYSAFVADITEAITPGKPCEIHLDVKPVGSGKTMLTAVRILKLD